MKAKDIDNIQFSRMVSSGKKNIINSLFIYMDYHYKTKPQRMMLPQTSTCVKCYNAATNGCIFSSEYD